MQEVLEILFGPIDVWLVVKIVLAIIVVALIAAKALIGLFEIPASGRAIHEHHDEEGDCNVHG